MLRLVFLLIRQRLQLAARDPASRAPASRARAPVFVAGTAVAALLLGAVAHALLGGRGDPAAPPARPVQPNAALQLLVARVEPAPLVVFLEALDAPEVAAGEDDHPAVRLTSVNAVFEPAFQVAPVAARVEVGNADPIAHNTHVFDGRRTLFNVAMPLQGLPVTKVLTRAGLFEVRCDLHPWMRAALFVPPNPHHLVIRQPGAFTLRDVAPGRYRLHAWDPVHGRTTQVVELSPGATRLLELAAR